MDDLEYIKKFSKITVSGICKRKKIQRTNLLQAKGRYQQNAKIVRKEIESEIAKLNHGEKNGESEKNTL